MDTVKQIINRIPNWNDEFTTEPVPGGYTNENYYIDRGSDKFVLRVSGKNTADLGINRKAEEEVYRAVSEAHIAPELVAYIEPEGHLLTRFVDGKPWDFPDFADPKVKAVVVEILKRAHSIEGVSHQFSPYIDILSRIEVCRNNDVALPAEIDSYLARLDAVKKRLDFGKDNRIGLCHNDPFPNNFLHNGKTWLLDWEFGGMGDVMWDIACITMGVDAAGKSEFMLLYYGSSTPDLLSLLEDARYVVRFWNGMWALLQSFLSPIDHDFSDWAHRIFSSMEDS